MAIQAVLILVSDFPAKTSLGFRNSPIISFTPGRGSVWTSFLRRFQRHQRQAASLYFGVVQNYSGGANGSSWFLSMVESPSHWHGQILLSSTRCICTVPWSDKTEGQRPDSRAYCLTLWTRIFVFHESRHELEWPNSRMPASSRCFLEHRAPTDMAAMR